MEAPAGKGYSLEELTQAVEQHKPTVLFVVQGESSTGVQQSLAGAQGERGFDALYIKVLERDSGGPNRRKRSFKRTGSGL